MEKFPGIFASNITWAGRRGPIRYVQRSRERGMRHRRRSRTADVTKTSSRRRCAERVLTTNALCRTTDETLIPVAAVVSVWRLEQAPDRSVTFDVAPLWCAGENDSFGSGHWDIALFHRGALPRSSRGDRIRPRQKVGRVFDCHIRRMWQTDASPAYHFGSNNSLTSYHYYS
jgi:hypothetical protein